VHIKINTLAAEEITASTSNLSIPLKKAKNIFIIAVNTILKLNKNTNCRVILLMGKIKTREFRIIKEIKERNILKGKYLLNTWIAFPLFLDISEIIRRSKPKSAKINRSIDKV